MRMNFYTSKAILNLVPGATWVINDGEFVEFAGGTQPTDDEIDAEIDRLMALQPFEDCKTKAKELIASTDWAVLPDVGLQNKTEFESYRASLRALILNPVADPVFPTEPQPVWS